jgi:hypothetical protein
VFDRRVGAESEVERGERLPGVGSEGGASNGFAAGAKQAQSSERSELCMVNWRLNHGVANGLSLGYLLEVDVDSLHNGRCCRNSVPADIG